MALVDAVAIVVVEDVVAIVVDAVAIVVVGMDDNDVVAVAVAFPIEDVVVPVAVVFDEDLIVVVVEVVVEEVVVVFFGMDMDDNDVLVAAVVAVVVQVVPNVVPNVAVAVVVDNGDTVDVGVAVAVVDGLDCVTTASVPNTAVVADCSRASAANPRPSPPPPTSKSLMPAAADAAWPCAWRLEKMEQLLLLGPHQV